VSAAVTWVRVPGGTCRYGDAGRPVQVPDLEWAATPLTYAQADLGGGDPELPVASVSHPEAAALAARLGGRLPRSVEWEWAAAGAARRRYPWGEAPWAPEKALLAPCGHRSPSPVGRHPAGATPEGLLDLAGLVWEWTASPTMGGGFVIRGGSYASAPLYARCTFLNAAPAELASPGIGLRPVRPA
jgi:iron(II)-dependent oxidoreductase